MKTFPIILILTMTLLSSCSSKTTPSDIDAILAQGKEYDDAKNYKNAYDTYKELAPLAETTAFIKMDVKNKLAKRGWSIDALESSLTLKIMTQMQNTINKNYYENAEMPDIQKEEYAFKDAWNNPLKLEIQVLPRHKKLFDYYPHILRT